MGEYKDLLREIGKSLEKFSKLNPKQMRAFHSLMEHVEGEGVLDKKIKELISIACGIVAHCKRCIAFHVDAALKAGASKEEILEAAWVAVLMGGGPALMYTQCVLEALEDFQK